MVDDENTNQSDDEKPLEQESEYSESEEEEVEEEPRGPNIFQRAWVKYKTNPRRNVPITVAVVLFLVFLIPASRYTVLGLAIKHDFNVTVIDSRTSIPVSGVELELNGRTAKTDGEGRATLTDVKVGDGTLRAKKTYYKDSETEVLVPLKTPKEPQEIKLEATGRRVPVYVTNRITGEPLENVQVKALGTEALTDKLGQTTIVLPADNPKTEGELNLKGFNKANVEITINEQAVRSNSFQLTPEGKVYFLSKRTGNINVMEANLDGSKPEVVVKATGREDENEAQLLTSRDRKYVALKIRREGKTARFYLIDTAKDELIEVDGNSEASVGFVGWTGKSFVYTVERTDRAYWESNRAALKTYDPETTKITTIDQTRSEGSDDDIYATEEFINPLILGEQILYLKVWQASYFGQNLTANKRNSVYKAYVNGGKDLLKDFPVSNTNYLASTQTKPSEAIVRYGNDFYHFVGGLFNKDSRIDNDDFNYNYPTYLLSASGEQTLWSEKRDGKNSIFIGDLGGNKPKAIAEASDYQSYGWFGNDYVLVSKNNSELFVMPASGIGEKGEIVKVTDYHRVLSGY